MKRTPPQGPVLCISCARKVGWWFVEGKWVLRNWSDRKHHKCPA